MLGSSCHRQQTLYAAIPRGLLCSKQHSSDSSLLSTYNYNATQRAKKGPAGPTQKGGASERGEGSSQRRQAKDNRYFKMKVNKYDFDDAMLLWIVEKHYLSVFRLAAVCLRMPLSACLHSQPLLMRPSHCVIVDFCSGRAARIARLKWRSTATMGRLW